MNDRSVLVNYPNPEPRFRISALWNLDSQNHKWINWKPTIPNDGSLVGRDRAQKGVINQVRSGLFWMQIPLNFQISRD
jgi:hypothetical protein